MDIDLINMDSKLKDLLDTGAIICGRIINENGIIRFERVNKEELEIIPKKERGYATLSMGRSIFTIDENGIIHNFKGVDSHLKASELGPVELVGAKAIEYVQGDGKYKVSALVFKDEKPEIRINGSSPLEDIEIEGDINRTLLEFGVKVPTINYIREIPQEYSLKYGLPIKVPGSLDDLKSNYAKEDNERKNRLKSIYGDKYIQKLDSDQRPETMKEYLQRIGFLSSPSVKSDIESLGYPLQVFIDNVDKYYSRGQRYAQAERIIDNPFRISDLETSIKHNNIPQLKSIMDFSEALDPNYEEKMAESFGKNIALLISNAWECENLIHRQDFSLGGNFCDDSYFDIFKKIEEEKEKLKNKPYKAEAFAKEVKWRFPGQVMHVASCVKVLQESMLLAGKSKEKIDSLLPKFVEGFTNNLDINKMGEIFHQDKESILEAVINEFGTKKNWAVKMSKLEREDPDAKDTAIYDSHIGNIDFYSKVGEMIAEKIKEKYIAHNEQGEEQR